MKQVLWLSSWYPNRCSVRNGNFVERQARITASFAGLWVVQVQYAGWSFPGGWELVCRKDKGFGELTVYFRCPNKAVWKLLFRGIAYLKGIWCTYRIQGRPDLIHAHVLLDAGCVAWLYSRLLGVPFLLSEHATLFQQDHLPSLVRRCSRWVIRSAAAVVPVSHQLRGRLERLSAGRFVVLGNPVNTELFYPAERSGSQKQLRFLHLSTLRQETKNVAGLLRVIASLREKAGILRFTLAGDGALEPWMRQAAECNLPDGFLRFSGALDEAGVADCMREHDVFVLFSFAENLPCVLLEAQACGLPVIATRVGGIPEIVPNERLGLLVNSGDEAGLRLAILRMVETYSGFDRQEIRAWAEARYGVSVFRKRLMDLYEQC